MSIDKQFNDESKNSQIVIYQNQDGNIKINVMLEENNVWLSQDQISRLFGKARTTITEHIKHIFTEQELDEQVVCRDFRHTTKHGAITDKSQERLVKYYNLDMIIAVGYRVRSMQGTQFRIWATQRIKEYLVKGFVLDDARFKNGESMQYFHELQDRIRQIRLSERLFYQKIKDIYTTSIDYDSKHQKTLDFFKIVQNKLLWAISQQTAAELVYRRVDASLPLLGMQSFDKSINGTIRKSDVSIAKNYLNEEEMKLLGLLVDQYLTFAESMAQQKIPMYMNDWIKRLDIILQLNKRELLSHAGKVSHNMALQKSELEFDKFKSQQQQIEKEQNLQELEEDIKSLQSQK
jgi:hypothetical protein